MPKTSAIPVLLQFNCGYARCAVKEITDELTAGKKGQAARMVNHKQRAEEFSKLFTWSTFGIPERFFEQTSKKTCQFFNFAVELSSMSLRNSGSYNRSVGSICLLSPRRDGES
jgi:hypothetical protein